jgi:L-lactate dehydrogenase complex protein LldG
MSSRDNILARIREALQVKAPQPHLQAPLQSTTQPPAGKEWLPDGGESLASSLAILESQLVKLKTILVRVSNEAEAIAAVQKLSAEKNWKQIAYQGHPWVTPIAQSLTAHTWQADTDFNKQKLEQCDVSLTSCEAIVAQLGSILVSSQNSGGRALSVLPHAHVVIARTSQVVPDLADAIRQIKECHGQRLPSMLSFITGPSRTGDIERILVLGAHGPKELFLVLIDG